MGACPSKNRLISSKLGLSRQNGQPTTHPSRFKTELPESTEAPTSCWGADQPRLYLANQSGYRVSYWVVQEDKKITKAHITRLASSMGMHLNLSSIITGGGVEGGVKKEKEEMIETGQGERVYFLLRDFRMEPRGSTQPTEVPFPAGCQAVRVYGFFEDGEEENEEEDGEWRPYKDKVYSIGRGHKSFTLNALNSNITPYARAKAEKQCSR